MSRIDHADGSYTLNGREYVPDDVHEQWQSDKRPAVPGRTEAHPGPSAPSTVLVRTAASTVKARRVEFLLEQRVPKGAMTLIAGDPGLGKSTWTCMLAALVTDSGGRVLIANAEDSPEAVIKPRLAAAGADLERVEFLTVRDEHGERGLSLPDDVRLIEQSVKDARADLVVLDPLNAFLAGSVDGHRDQHVRRALAPLARLAETHRLALVVCVHLNKAPGTDAVYRVGGSIGLVGGARSLVTFTRDPDDPDGEQGQRRLLSHAKSNWGRLARGLLYDVTEHTLELDGHDLTTTALRDAGESELTGAEALGRGDESPPSTVRELATEVLADALGGGERRRSEVAEQAARRGVSDRTLDRAARDVGVIATRQGFPAVTFWRLPDSPANHSPATVAEQDVAEQQKPDEHRDSQPVEALSRHTPESGGAEAPTTLAAAWHREWVKAEAA